MSPWVSVLWLCMLLQTACASEDGRCSGCRDQKHANDLFDHLGFAVKYHERLSYLALDMSWLERVMNENGKVHISFHQFSRDNLETGHELLDDMHLKSLASFHDNSEHKDHKPVYYDADGCKIGSRCGLGNNETQTDKTATATTATTESVSSKGEGKGEHQGTARKVIRVKRHRRLLRESDVENTEKNEGRQDLEQEKKVEEENADAIAAADGKNRKSFSSSSSSRTESIIKLQPYDEEFQILAFGFDKWKDITRREYEVRLDTFLAMNPCWVPIYEPPIPFGEFDYQDDEVVKEGGSPDDLNLHTPLLLARLPSHSFYATCKFYKAIVARQFPPVCFYKNNRMAVFHLGNLGYGHVLSYLVHAYTATIQKTTYRQRKLFSVPFAHQFLSHYNKSMTNHTRGGAGLWAWADPKRCDPQVYLNNPWACNFIPFTNCSNRAKTLRAEIRPIDLLEWQRVDRFLAANITDGGAGNVNDAMRIKYVDAPQLNDDEWAKSRLFAFFERPNTQLRLLIRESLSRVRLASTVVQHLAPAPDSPEAPSLFIDKDEHREPKEWRRARNRILDVPQCLVMHVRTVDYSAIDVSSSDSGGNNNISTNTVAAAVERGLLGHVKMARELRSRIGGTSTIFLTTDNASVVYQAAKQFPDFQWITQLRPLSGKAEMFQMFTEPFVAVMHNNKPQTIKGHDYIVLLEKTSTSSADHSLTPPKYLTDDNYAGETAATIKATTNTAINAKAKVKATSSSTSSSSSRSSSSSKDNEQAGSSSSNNNNNDKIGNVELSRGEDENGEEGAVGGNGDGSGKVELGRGEDENRQRRQRQRQRRSMMAAASSNSGKSNTDSSSSSIRYSVQRDLSHVIADLRYASKCNVTVGASDSGFAGLLESHMASMRDPQHRPAFIDILASAEDRVRKLDLVEISTFAVPEGRKHVVAFALESRSYDKDVNFTMGGGLFNNADIFTRFYPNWTCRVYMDVDADPEVSQGIKTSLVNDGVEVLPLPSLKSGKKMHAAIARHLVAADPTVDRFVVRDNNMRLNERERFAVQEWVQSPSKSFHVMRDHWLHCDTKAPMRGGMWGGVKGPLSNMQELVEQWYSNDKQRPAADLANDALFLREMVWPRLLADNAEGLLSHDSYCCEQAGLAVGESRPFPRQRDPSFEHVGQTFHVDSDIPITPVALLKQRPAPVKCRKQEAWKYG